jgi:hypothetical protein
LELHFPISLFVFKININFQLGGFFFCYFFHQTSWNIVGIFTIVCGSFWCVDKIQNGGRCHGNLLKHNISVCKSACDKKHYCKVAWSLEKI